MNFFVMKAVGDSGHDLFASHQRYLGVGDKKNDPRDAIEFVRIDAIRLKPLNLPARSTVRKRLSTTQLYIGLAVAAAIALMVLPVLHKPDLSIKGRSRATLYWDRQGIVTPWRSGDPLANGDKINAEVLATQPAVAFFGVYDRSGKLLLNSQQFLGSSMDLAAGERSEFARSFELIGRNEGEQAVVFVCRHNGIAGRREQAFYEQVRILKDMRPNTEVEESCDYEVFPLR